MRLRRCAGNVTDERLDGPTNLRMRGNGRRERTAAALNPERAVCIDYINVATQCGEDTGGSSNPRIEIAVRLSAGAFRELMPNLPEYRFGLLGR